MVGAMDTIKEQGLYALSKYAFLVDDAQKVKTLMSRAVDRDIQEIIQIETDEDWRKVYELASLALERMKVRDEDDEDDES